MHIQFHLIPIVYIKCCLYAIFYKEITKKFKYLIYRLCIWAYGKLCFSFSIVTDVGDDVQSSWVKGNLNISSIFKWRVRSRKKKKSLNQGGILLGKKKMKRENKTFMFQLLAEKDSLAKQRQVASWGGALLATVTCIGLV